MKTEEGGGTIFTKSLFFEVLTTFKILLNISHEGTIVVGARGTYQPAAGRDSKRAK